MGPEGTVSLILVSSCGWKLFAGALIGLQVIFYLQSKKSNVSLHSVLQGLIFIILEIDLSDTNVVLQFAYTNILSENFLVSKNISNLSFYHFLLDFSHFILTSLSEKIFSIVYGLWFCKNDLLEIKLL